MVHKIAGVAALALFSGCAFIDATEHCVQTRYGRVTNEQMEPGIAGAWFVDYTCFPLTEQNFPEAEREAEVVDAVTNDRLPVTVDLALTWEYDQATILQVFMEKRSPERVKVELVNAVREGARIALASWTIDDLIGPRRAELGAAMTDAMNNKLAGTARVKTVFVRGVGLPEEITAQQLARIEAIRARETAIERFRADSVSAFSREYQANVDARVRQIQSEVYNDNPALLQLEIARVQAEALGGIFATCTQNCILGGTTTDAFLLRN